MRERKIGEVFEFDGKRFRVKLNQSDSCRNCAFYADKFEDVACRSVLTCDKEYRADGQNVMAAEAEEVEPHHGFTECDDSDACHNRYNGACLGDEECLEMDRPGLTLPDEPCRYDPQSRYYDAGNIEVFEIIKAKLKPEQFRGYLLGNVIKYATRLEHKGQAERDAEKLKRYATWLWETFDV